MCKHPVECERESTLRLSGMRMHAPRPQFGICQGVLVRVKAIHGAENPEKGDVWWEDVIQVSLGRERRMRLSPSDAPARFGMSPPMNLRLPSADVQLLTCVAWPEHKLSEQPEDGSTSLGVPLHTAPGAHP